MATDVTWLSAAASLKAVKLSPSTQIKIVMTAAWLKVAKSTIYIFMVRRCGDSGSDTSPELCFRQFDAEIQI